MEPRGGSGDPPATTSPTTNLIPLTWFYFSWQKSKKWMPAGGVEPATHGTTRRQWRPPCHHLPYYQPYTIDLVLLFVAKKQKVDASGRSRTRNAWNHEEAVETPLPPPPLLPTLYH